MGRQQLFRYLAYVPTAVLAILVAGDYDSYLSEPFASWREGNMWELIIMVGLFTWACHATVSWWGKKTEVDAYLHTGPHWRFDMSAGKVADYVMKKLRVDLRGANKFITKQFIDGKIPVMATMSDKNYREELTPEKLSKSDMPGVHVLPPKIDLNEVEISLRPLEYQERLHDQLSIDSHPSGWIWLKYHMKEGMIAHSPQFIRCNIKALVKQHKAHRDSETENVTR